MVKAELCYNPYLLETTIRFNGQAPRINSLVEKYQEGTLQSWVRKLPSVFYDEMNGYDFELEFSGTKLDYEEVKQAFRDAGVTEREVQLFLKNELDSRETKTQQIAELLTWLSENRNRTFDYDAFSAEHNELFEDSYPFIIINGKALSLEVMNGLDSIAELIEDIDELKSTDLHLTPILYYLSADVRRSYQGNIRALLNRKDVEQNQLFFMIAPELDRDMVKRTISDLGVEEPQLVESLEDEAILKYMTLFPVSDYIYQAIRCFREKTDRLEQELAEASRISEMENREIYAQLSSLEHRIKRLKDADVQFTNRDNIAIPDDWKQEKEEMLQYIRYWRIRKTKITRDDLAFRAANEFEAELRSRFATFLRMLYEAVCRQRADIEANYSAWYQAAEYKDGYAPSIDDPFSQEYRELPQIAEPVLELKEVNYVQPKEDMFGKFFRSTPEADRAPVREVTYYNEAWRNYAVGAVEPVIAELIQTYYAQMQQYEQQLAEQYMTHIAEEIAGLTAEKDATASQLSEEEQLLQDDHDWLSVFVDQLKAIERG